MTNRNPVLVDLPTVFENGFGPLSAFASKTLVEIGDALERTVSGCETLSLDSESDRAVLISRLKRALGLSA